MKIRIQMIDSDYAGQFIYKQFEPPVFVGFEPIVHSRWNRDHYMVCTDCYADNQDAMWEMAADAHYDAMENASDCDD